MRNHVACLCLLLALPGCVGTQNFINPQVNTQINAQANTAVAVAQSSQSLAGAPERRQAPPPPTAAPPSPIMTSASPMAYSTATFSFSVPGNWRRTAATSASTIAQFSIGVGSDVATVYIAETSYISAGLADEARFASFKHGSNLLSANSIIVDGSRALEMTYLAYTGGFNFNGDEFYLNMNGRGYSVNMLTDSASAYNTTYTTELRQALATWKWTPLTPTTSGFAPATSTPTPMLIATPTPAPAATPTTAPTSTPTPTPTPTATP